MVLVDYNIPVIQLWLRWCSLVLFIYLFLALICKCNQYRHQCTDSSTGWFYKHIFSTSWTTTGAIQCWSWCIYKTLQLLLDTCSNNSSRNAAAKPTKSETWRRVLTSGASLKPSLLCLTLMALNWQPEDESSSRGSDAPDFHNPDIIWEKSPEIWVCGHRFNTEPDQELNRLDLLVRLVWAILRFSQIHYASHINNCWN